MEVLTPDDIYRKSILKYSGRPETDFERLRSIIGLEELNKVLSKFKEIDYSTGENCENLKKHTYRANLHIHTFQSDGEIDAKKLLDDSANYADEVAVSNPELNEPFIIAITDHDTLDSVYSIVDEVYSNPEKYKNLRIILGCEMTTLVEDEPEKMFHMLTYCVNPYEPKYKNFIDNLKSAKHKAASEMTRAANQIYKTFYGKEVYNLEEAGRMFCFLKTNLLGVHNYINAYFAVKAVIYNQAAPFLNKNANELMKELIFYWNKIGYFNKARSAQYTLNRFLSENYGIYDFRVEKTDFLNELSKQMIAYKWCNYEEGCYVPSIAEVADALSNQRDAILGIAHPLDVLKDIKDEKKQEYLDSFYENFVRAANGKAGFSEVYYQSYRNGVEYYADNFAQQLNDLSNKFNLYKTGSIDTHGMVFYKRLT